MSTGQVEGHQNKYIQQHNTQKATRHNKYSE